MSVSMSMLFGREIVGMLCARLSASCHVAIVAFLVTWPLQHPLSRGCCGSLENIGDLEKYIDQSAVINIFLSRGERSREYPLHTPANHCIVSPTFSHRMEQPR